MREKYLDVWLSYTTMHDTIQKELTDMLMSRYDLPLNHFYTLLFLSRAENRRLTQFELQQYIGLSQSATSRMIDKMVENQLGVKKFAHPEDKRNFYIILAKDQPEFFEDAYNDFIDILQKY